jgi:hypothetical protein
MTRSPPQYTRRASVSPERTGLGLRWSALLAVGLTLFSVLWAAITPDAAPASGWAIEPIPSPARSTYRLLNGISRPKPHECIAVGEYTTTISTKVAEHPAICLAVVLHRNGSGVTTGPKPVAVTVRFVVRGVLCNKAHSLIRTYFRHETTPGYCPKQGNICAFVSGGWTCSFPLYAGEGGGDFVSCSRKAPFATVKVYRVTRRASTAAEPSSLRTYPAWVAASSAR